MASPYVEEAARRAVYPTAEQFSRYRAERRFSAHRIISCVKAGTISMTDWAAGVIRQTRADHTASIRRQRALQP